MSNNFSSIGYKPKFPPPPENYIPGLGRGAIGFTTRSDIGPMKLTSDTP